MAPRRMTRSSVVAALVVTVLLGLLIWWRDEHSRVERTTGALTPPSKAIPRAMGVVKAVPAARSAAPAAEPALVPPAASARSYEPQMTDEMRERRRRVLESQAASRRAADPAAKPELAAAEPQGLQDRTGKMGPEVQALDEQLIPLIDQCFDQARARGVRGRGMLALEVKLAGAEGIGRIIESVEPAPDNDIHDPELIDCARQSAFTVDLPPPTSSGSSEGVMTIPFEGAADAGVASPR
jgi:hypothetical protein